MADHIASDNIARDLRAAVLVGDHVEASRIAEMYKQALTSEWQRMSQSERMASNMPQKSCELLTWAADVTKMQHAMVGQQLSALSLAHQYLKARTNYIQSSVE